MSERRGHAGELARRAAEEGAASWSQSGATEP